MFIRKKTKFHPKTKKAYPVYQLIESVRTQRGPRQRILLSLGSDLNMSDEDLKLLANRIEEIFLGSPSLFSCPNEIEQLAQEYASQLIRRQSSPQVPESTAQTPDYRSIDIASIEQQEPRTVGAEHLLLHFALQLELPKKLKNLGLSEKEIALSLGTIIARAVFPASERATHEWLTKRSGLGELIDFDFNQTSLQQLYKISDLLLEQKDELEKYLTQTQRAIHGYRDVMLLYALTNTYMEGQAEGNTKAKRGVSKEKRGDCPLVTLGLVINEYGFVTRSSFLPGNISEPRTLQQAIDALHHSEDLLKPVVILDAGIAPEDNLKWLRERRFPYVVSARQNAPSMELAGPLVPVDDPEEPQVKAALIKNDSEEERWLYCESKAKAAVASEIKAAFQKRFETDLTNLKKGLVKPKGRKKYSKIMERIGRLKEKHSRVSGCYEIVVEASDDCQTATSIQWVLKPEKLEEKLNGYYFLRTNLIHLEPEPLWNLYNSIRTIEDAFRFMKSSLGLRPVHHQKTHRVDGHLWITILAYHLIRSCLYQLQQKKVNSHWATIRNQMSSRVRVTVQARTQEGQILYIRTTTKAEMPQQHIYRNLGMKGQILKARKTVD
jgi:transposase